MADLKTCACREVPKFSNSDSFVTVIKKCTHCVEVEQVARLTTSFIKAWAPDNGLVVDKFLDRARACGLLED